MEVDKTESFDWSPYWERILSSAHSINRLDVIRCALAPVIPTFFGGFLGNLVGHILEHDSPYKSINLAAWTLGGVFVGMALGLVRTYLITKRSLTHTFWNVLHMTPAEGRQYAMDLYWSIPGYLCSYELSILMRQPFVPPPPAKRQPQNMVNINTLL
jgi:hypothetical protein